MNSSQSFIIIIMYYGIFKYPYNHYLNVTHAEQNQLIWCAHASLVDDHIKAKGLEYLHITWQIYLDYVKILKHKINTHDAEFY